VTLLQSPRIRATFAARARRRAARPEEVAV
jgi:hypothetical protein